jgi:Bacterial SH3 domain
MLSPSDIVIRPAGLTEPVATGAAADRPTLPDPTPSTMAERFAPEGQKAPGESPARPQAASAASMVAPGLIAEPPRVPASNRWLLVASILISLVPTAIILALIWQGAIRLPRSHDMPIVFEQDRLVEEQQMAAVTVPAMAAPQPVEIAVKPEIVLTAPARLEAKTGEETDFDLAIDSAEALPARSIIAIRSLPEGASLSQGRPYGDGEWNLRPDEIGDLQLKLPKTASAAGDLRIELMAADGTVLAGTTTRLEIASDPKATLILRSNEATRVDDLIAHGQKMIDVGYLAGARAYFKRAAEAGSGEAALKLGATYDPDFIDGIGALGVKADLNEARVWYERAKQLGIEGAEAKLKALKETWTNRDAPAQAAQAAVEKPGLAEAEPDDDADVPAPPPSAEVMAAPPRASAPLLGGKEEWVALLNYANLRAAPSTTADTIKVAEKGARLRVTGRKGNWVQVTDPATAEVGWVYARFIETAEAPSR